MILGDNYCRCLFKGTRYNCVSSCKLTWFGPDYSLCSMVTACNMLLTIMILYVSDTSKSLYQTYRSDTIKSVYLFYCSVCDIFVQSLPNVGPQWWRPR